MFQPDFGAYRGLARVLFSPSSPPNCRNRNKILEKGTFPVLPFLAFLEKARKTSQKTRIFLYAEPLKSLGNKGKTLKKQGNSLQQKKQGNPKKQGKEDQSLFSAPNSGMHQTLVQKRSESVPLSGNPVQCMPVTRLVCLGGCLRSWEFAKGGGGKTYRAIWGGRGETYYKAPPPNPPVSPYPLNLGGDNFTP